LERRNGFVVTGERVVETPQQVMVPPEVGTQFDRPAVRAQRLRGPARSRIGVAQRAVRLVVAGLQADRVLEGRNRPCCRPVPSLMVASET
jgi:hypothetical protein